MDIVGRLKQYIEYIGEPISVFADSAGIPRPTLSQILNGRNKKISNEVFEKLHAGYPKLNVMWLMFGDGDMEIEANTQTSEPQNGQKSLFDDPQPAEDERSNASTYDNPTIYQASQSTQSTPKSAEQAPYQRHVDYQEPERQQQHVAQSVEPSATVAFAPDASKKIQSIMVFYTDSSFEIFSPAQNR